MKYPYCQSNMNNGRNWLKAKDLHNLYLHLLYLVLTRSNDNGVRFHCHCWHGSQFRQHHKATVNGCRKRWVSTMVVVWSQIVLEGEFIRKHAIHTASHYPDWILPEYHGNKAKINVTNLSLAQNELPTWLAQCCDISHSVGMYAGFWLAIVKQY